MMLCLMSAETIAPQEQWVRVHPYDATSSSYLQSGYNRFDENYHPRYVLDDDAMTAWTEGEPSHGAGSWLRLHLHPMPAVQRVTLRLRSGYQKSATLLEANAAPQRLRVSLLDADSRVQSSHVVTLERQLDWQETTLSAPQPVSVSVVQLEVLDVHPGEVYPDLCISDVQMLVADVLVNAEPQEVGHAAILSWIAERQAAASAEGERPSMFSSHRYRLSAPGRFQAEKGATARRELASLKQLDALHQLALREGTLTRGEAIQRPHVVRMYEALEHQESTVLQQMASPMLGLEYLFDLENLHFSPTEARWRNEQRAAKVNSQGSDDSLDITYTRSNLRVLRDENGQVTAIAGQMRFHDWSEQFGMRGYNIEEQDFLVTYADGQVDRLMTITSSWSGQGDERSTCVLVFSRDRGARISGIQELSFSNGNVYRQRYHPL